MPENDRGGKKVLIISVLIFLFFGGGIFLFFIIEGGRDFRDEKTRNFHYASEARTGAASFFKYIGFADNEPVLSGRNNAEERYFAVEKEPSSLLEDWMKPESAAAEEAGEKAPYGRAGGASAGRSAVPRMGTRGAGGSFASAGGSQSSAEFSGFSASGSGKDVQVAKSGLSGVRSGGPQKGTLSALKASLGFLGDGLRSASASTAKAKWDSSFGAGMPGGGGQASYSGRLAGLDRIKSGEIASLKYMEKSKSLGIPEVGAPVRNKEAERGDPVLDKAKEAVKDAADPTKGLANSMFSPVANAIGSSVNPGRDNNSASNGDTSGGAPDNRSGSPAIPPSVDSFIKDYGPTSSVNYMPGAPPGCQEMGMACADGYWKVEYANGTWASFAVTDDKDPGGNPIPLAFDQCLSPTACKK